jgi:hypothetical protein
VPTCDRCHEKYTGTSRHPLPKAAAHSALDGAFAMSIADLHEEPEPALPTTDGADEAKMEQARQALLRAQAADQAADPAKVSLSPMGWVALRNAIEGKHAYSSDRGLGDARRAGLIEQDSETVTPLGRAVYEIAYGKPLQGEASVSAPSTREASEARHFLADAERSRSGGPDPHAWLLNGSGGDSDVAAMAQQFLAVKGTKTALKDFSAAERKSIIDEGDGIEAGNLGGLDLTGTHYQMMESARRAKAQVDDSLGW